jgi:ribosomal protein S18 acetylase RimI-like enzyme
MIILMGELFVILMILARFEETRNLEGLRGFYNVEYGKRREKVDFQHLSKEFEYPFLMENCGLSGSDGVEKGRDTVNVTTREATKRDLPQIIGLLSQLSPTGEPNTSLKKAASVFKKIRRYPFYKIYVSVLDERIVGVFELMIMDNLAHLGKPSAVIEDVVVTAERRRRGIGKIMMNYAMNVCREMGCYKLTLSSNLKREEAHDFYESLGFRKHGFSFHVELAEELP